MFIIYCALIGFAASGLIILISSKVNNKRLACVLCCLLGMAVAVGITVRYYWSIQAKR
jgi:hypothetical protein